MLPPSLRQKGSQMCGLFGGREPMEWTPARNCAQRCGSLKRASSGHAESHFERHWMVWACHRAGSHHICIRKGVRKSGKKLNYTPHSFMIQAMMYMSASLGGFGHKNSSAFVINLFLMRKATHCFPSL